jgi:hypothetical protein
VGICSVFTKEATSCSNASSDFAVLQDPIKKEAVIKEEFLF